MKVSTRVVRIDDEYQVRLILDGREYKPARYFTGDRADAHGTALAMTEHARSHPASYPGREG